MRKVALGLSLVALLTASGASAQTWQKPTSAFGPNVLNTSLPIDSGPLEQTKDAKLILKTVDFSTLRDTRPLSFGVDQKVGTNNANLVFEATDGKTYFYNAQGFVFSNTNVSSQVLIGATSSMYGGDKLEVTGGGVNVNLRSGDDNTWFYGSVNGVRRFAINWGNAPSGSVPVFQDKFVGKWKTSIALKAGNVGIGTESPDPAYRLDVNGAINANEIYVGGKLLQGSGTSIVYGGGTAGQLSAWTSPTELGTSSLRQYSTTTPGFSGVSLLSSRLYTLSDGSDPYYYIQSTASDTGLTFQQYAGGFNFKTGKENTVASIDTNGSAKFAGRSTIGTPDGDWTGLELTTKDGGGLDTGHRWVFYADNAKEKTLLSQGPNSFAIWEYGTEKCGVTGAVCNSRLQIKAGGDTVLVPSGGNVGVGFNNPDTKFGVQGNIKLVREPGDKVSPGPGPELILESPSNNVSVSALTSPVQCGSVGNSSGCPADTANGDKVAPKLSCDDLTVGTPYTDVYQGTGDIYVSQVISCKAGTASYALRTNNGTLEFWNGSNAAMKIKHDGKVGIGMDPGAEFDVNGWVRASGARFNTATVDADATVTGLLTVGGGIILTSGSITGSPNFSGGITAPAITIKNSSGRAAFNGLDWLPHGSKTAVCSMGQGTSGYASVNDGRVIVTVCRAIPGKDYGCSSGINKTQVQYGDQTLSASWKYDNAAYDVGNGQQLLSLDDIKHAKFIRYSKGSGNIEYNGYCEF